MLLTTTPGAAEFSMVMQRAEAAERAGLAGRGGHRDHRDVGHRADHRGQRGVQAGDDDQAVDVAEQRAVGEQARGSGCRRCRRPATTSVPVTRATKAASAATGVSPPPALSTRTRPTGSGTGPTAAAIAAASMVVYASCSLASATRVSAVARSTSAGRWGCSRRASRTSARICSVRAPVPQMTSRLDRGDGHGAAPAGGHRAEQRLGGAAGAEGRVGGDQERSETTGVGAVVQRGRLHVRDSSVRSAVLRGGSSDGGGPNSASSGLRAGARVWVTPDSRTTRSRPLRLAS